MFLSTIYLTEHFSNIPANLAKGCRYLWGLLREKPIRALGKRSVKGKKIYLIIFIYHKNDPQ